MRFIRSLSIAFAMFSRIPVPKVDWDRDNMRYTMAVFPLVGLVVGISAYVGWWIVDVLAFGSLAKGVALAVIPVLLTGGIHLDGYADTVDALASHGDKDKKLAILKDPHTGAFAIIGLCLYFMCYTALTAELNQTFASIGTYGSVFVLSRAFAVLFMLSVPPARADGLGRLFHDASIKKMTLVTALLVGLTVIVAGLYMNGATGAFLPAAIIITLCYCRRMAYREFGGVTGDLTGYCIQVSEIAGLAGIVLGQKISIIIGVMP